MSLWVVALGLAAGYVLTTSKRDMTSIVNDARAKFQGAAAPSTPGPSSESIRQTQEKSMDDFSTDVHFKVGPGQKLAMAQAQKSMQAEVQAYESKQLPEIEGVYFQLGTGGF